MHIKTLVFYSEVHREDWTGITAGLWGKRQDSCDQGKGSPPCLTAKSFFGYHLVVLCCYRASEGNAKRLLTKFAKAI